MNSLTKQILLNELTKTRKDEKFNSGFINNYRIAGIIEPNGNEGYHYGNPWSDDIIKTINGNIVLNIRHKNILEYVYMLDYKIETLYLYENNFKSVKKVYHIGDLIVTNSKWCEIKEFFLLHKLDYTLGLFVKLKIL